MIGRFYVNVHYITCGRYGYSVEELTQEDTAEVSKYDLDNVHNMISLHQTKDSIGEYPWYIILPGNPYKDYWDILIFCAVVYTAFMTPFALGWGSGNVEESYGLFTASDGGLFPSATSQALDTFEVILDCAFLVDMILMFFTAYVEEEELIADL